MAVKRSPALSVKGAPSGSTQVVSGRLAEAHRRAPRASRAPSARVRIVIMPTAPRAAAIRRLSPFRWAATSLGMPGGRAAEHDDDLAAHVEPAIIVEAVRWHVEPVAGEDHRRLERQRRRVGACPHRDVMPLREGAAGDGQRRRAGQPDRTNSTGWNQPPSVARAQAERLELGGDVARGDFVAARPGLAAFEQIVGEEGDMGAEGVGAELAGAGCRRLGEASTRTATARRTPASNI